MATFQRQSANYVEIAGGFCSASIALQPSNGEGFGSKYVGIAGADYEITTPAKESPSLPNYVEIAGAGYGATP